MLISQISPSSASVKLLGGALGNTVPKHLSVCAGELLRLQGQSLGLLQDAIARLPSWSLPT